jgi:hypothetical protein
VRALFAGAGWSFWQRDVSDCVAWLSVLRAAVAFGRGVMLMSLVGVRALFECLELCICLVDALSAECACE